MRVLFHPLFWAVDAHTGQQFDGLGLPVLLGYRTLRVQPEDLDQLRADGLHRIQAGSGVLRNQADTGTADLPPGMHVQTGHLGAAEADGTG